MNHHHQQSPPDHDDLGQEPINWTTWLNDNGPKLLLYARQQCRRDSDAEDILQEALVQLVRAVESGDFRGQPAQWVSYAYTAIRHRSMDRGRHHDVRKNYEEKLQTIMEEEDHNSMPWLSCAADDEYLRDGVEKLLKQIPAEFSEVIVLKIWGERTFQQIADILGAPLATVSSRYRYGLQALRKLLENNPIEL